MKFKELNDEYKILVLIFISTLDNKYVFEKQIVDLLRHMKLNGHKDIWNKYKEKFLDLGMLERVYKTKQKQYVYWISDECYDWVRNVYLHASELRND